MACVFECVHVYMCEDNEYRQSWSIANAPARSRQTHGILVKGTERDDQSIPDEYSADPVRAACVFSWLLLPPNLTLPFPHRTSFAPTSVMYMTLWLVGVVGCLECESVDCGSLLGCTMNCP